MAERIEQVQKSVDPDHICFALLGDHKNDRDIFPSIIKEINNDPEIAFVIHLGDVVERPRKVFYRDALKTVTAFLHKPILVVPGNHDVNCRKEDTQFEQAFGPRHYSFQIGDACFVIADSQRLGSTAEQNWLRETLKRQKCENRLLLIHIPLDDPRGNGKHHCLDQKTAGKLNEILAAHPVTHIFTGHLHGYWTGKWGDTPYTITAGGGAALDSRDPAHGFHHYLKVRIEDRRIREEVVAVNATRFSRAMNEVSTCLQVEPLQSILLVIIVISGLWSARKWMTQGLSSVNRDGKTRCPAEPNPGCGIATLKFNSNGRAHPRLLRLALLAVPHRKAVGSRSPLDGQDLDGPGR